MQNIGEHRNAEAWRDLLAIHRLGRLVAQGPTLVEQLIGFALAGIANDGTAVLLHEGNLTKDEARKVMQDLDSLPPFSGVADSLDHMERLMYLDMIIQFSQGNFELDRQTMKQIGMGENVVYLRHLNIDWNIALRNGNKYFDRYAAAARTSDYAARHAAFQKIYNELSQSARNVGVGTVISSALNPSVRSDAVASIFLQLFLPAADAAINAQERVNAHLELLRIGAALALFRAEHGTYPEKLDELVPAILPKLPVDFFNAKPYAYKRIGEGYLLYSFGPNGVDDDASNELNAVLEGRPLNDMTPSEADVARPKIPAHADDFSLRVPRLPVKMRRVVMIDSIVFRLHRMSSSDPLSPPKKKRSILWWLGGALPHPHVPLLLSALRPQPENHHLQANHVHHQPVAPGWLARLRAIHARIVSPRHHSREQRCSACCGEPWGSTDIDAKDREAFAAELGITDDLLHDHPLQPFYSTSTHESRRRLAQRPRTSRTARANSRQRHDPASAYAGLYEYSGPELNSTN